MNKSSDIKKVVIVGGGSAGWMSAMIFAKAMLGKGIQICVVESPSVGIIGVGEGSTPALKGFFDSLGIPEAEWMPECHATYKCGITFDKWSTRPGFNSYFHPFGSVLDNFSMPLFVQNVQARLQGKDVDAHPDRYFIASKLAEQHMAPKPNHNFPFPVWYGYHFDAVLLGQYLHKKALALGVTYLSRHVSHASLDEQGRINAIHCKDGDEIQADFFVDCSGFTSLLSQQTLQTPFISFSNNLFNDSAIAMPTPIGESIPSQTVSTAMKHGWAWEIPLTSRFGNGYVYSSSFCSADDAEFELREKLGLLDSDTPARHLKMKVGRVSKPWQKNCLAVGLSQGFIEPLEATALLYVQRSAANFIEFFERGDLSEKAQDDYNARFNAGFEGTHDYIVSHYKTNSRTDTDYWRANAGNTQLSEPLKQLYGMWSSADKSLKSLIREQKIGVGYPILSWYCLLAGMGIFPTINPNAKTDIADNTTKLTQLDELLNRSALNFKSQKEILQNIPTAQDNPLQLYLW